MFTNNESKKSSSRGSGIRDRHASDLCHSCKEEVCQQNQLLWPPEKICVTTTGRVRAREKNDDLRAAIQPLRKLALYRKHEFIVLATKARISG